MLDGAPGYKTDNVKEKFHRRGTLMAMIPGGLTKKLQVLDISVNKSFKSRLRSRWENWLINGYKNYTKSGNLKRVSYEEITKWISEAWNEVPVSTITSGFKKTTIKFYGDDEEEIDQVSEEDPDDNDDDMETNDEEIRDQLIDILTDERNFGSDEEDDDRDRI